MVDIQICSFQYPQPCATLPDPNLVLVDLQLELLMPQSSIRLSTSTMCVSQMAIWSCEILEPFEQTHTHSTSTLRFETRRSLSTMNEYMLQKRTHCRIHGYPNNPKHIGSAS
jgi:hypothetical protein